MSHVTYDIRLNTTRRKELLCAIPGFADLPADVLEHLAKQMLEESFVRGEQIVSEGESADRLYLVVRGRAEASTMAADGPVPLAVLEPGDLFGEVALLLPERVRTATVTALTQMLALSLHEDTFKEVLASRPDVTAAFSLVAENLLLIKFLKRATPFGALDGSHVRMLAKRLQRRDTSPGQIIVREGETGDACYLVGSGSVEVVTEEHDGSQRRLAFLTAGMLFGEATLLADAPRNATVRAVDPGELFILRRSDLLDLMRANRGFGSRMFDLLRMRSRPKRVDGIEMLTRTTADGDTLTVLKDRVRDRRFRLSEIGRFVWDRLDGAHALRDIQIETYGTFKSATPEIIAEIVNELAAAGFLENTVLRADVPQLHLSFVQRLRERFKRK
jgi:CRP-like cAMP-binding protein